MGKKYTCTRSPWTQWN